ncbi:MAG: tRNA (adenosine(37)-N6)-dimethylallyltransferase MiaA, partial [Gammaproteobacteria bacterium]|nr:tRNA (adenosine(37)-N6)-dimethylallyltransferase MiaA [Gammaproteobacteria bacterium]
MNDKPTVALLMGPTASGKTELAIRLCEQSNFEIISVDSAMVYRGMDIGSAKPSHEELSRAPHRLIDIRDPREAYSAAEFRRDALREISEIHQNGNIPLLVGGTMLYFKVLLEGVAQMPATEPSIRADVEAMARLHGWPHVHQLL